MGGSRAGDTANTLVKVGRSTQTFRLIDTTDQPSHFAEILDLGAECVFEESFPRQYRAYHH
jgi:hypothetical protein